MQGIPRGASTTAGIMGGLLGLLALNRLMRHRPPPYPYRNPPRPPKRTHELGRPEIQAVELNLQAGEPTLDEKEEVKPPPGLIPPKPSKRQTARVELQLGVQPLNESGDVEISVYPFVSPPRPPRLEEFVSVVLAVGGLTWAGMVLRDLFRGDRVLEGLTEGV